MKPKESRRSREREFTVFDIRKAFKIPKDEMILNMHYDSNRNSYVIETLLDFDATKGDIWGLIYLLYKG